MRSITAGASYGTKVSGIIVLERSGIYYAGGGIKNIKVTMGTEIDTGQPTRATFMAEGQIPITDGGTNFYDPSGVVLQSSTSWHMQQRRHQVERQRQHVDLSRIRTER